MNVEIPQAYYDLINEAAHYHESDNEEARIVSVAKLPSRFGNFTAVAYHQHADEKEHAAFVKGNVIEKENVLVRIHSECLTGDAIGSLRCDCREQLESALERIEDEGEGIVLYLRQEGRGIGLTNKLKAYKLQDEGLNTVEANHALGFPDDMREYKLAAEMLQALKVKSVRLMTNNPDKIEQLRNHGIDVIEREPHQMAPNIHNEFYLQTKKKLSRHMIEI